MQTRNVSKIGAMLLLFSGCASFSSTVLSRLDDNSYVGNSNGNPNIFCGTRPYKGVPITLSVTTHLDVFIEETYFMQPKEQQFGGKSDLTDVATVRPIRNVRAEQVKSKKVFLVDMKRPGSGTLTGGMEFNDQQYFDKITGEIADTTIKDSTALLATIITKLPTGKQTAGESQAPFEYLKRTRVAAYKRFDINAPDFETQVDTFVSQHLYCVGNACDYAEIGTPPEEGEVSMLANQ
jgi:hypothetical protein